MASPDLDEPADREPGASSEAPGSSIPGGCAEGLGLLVWLGQLARDESARRPSCSGAELLDAPRSIGRFELEALLGAGAYGAVFRALDTQLGRCVALKLAWPGVLMDPVAGRRFIEEPKTVAALKHRGIVEVYESGEIEMAAYIALELVDGPTLGQWLKVQEHVSPRLAAQIVRSVAEAVHYAHERNVVHRDLKPGNILLRPCDNGDAFGFEPVVTDFGLARRPRLSEMSMLTATHAIIGTDHYMSPEQAAGRTEDVGPASDIFSLGVILYELVAGCRPFDGESSEQVRRRIQEDEPAPIRPWRSSVPKDLETIALKCLEKTPSRRYGSAQELADDLGRFLDNKPIHARPVGMVQRAWKLARRKPLAVSLVSLAVASLLTIAGLGGAWDADRANSARRIEAAEAEAATFETLQRHQEYVASVSRAADALAKGGRGEVLEHLEECRALAYNGVDRGVEWELLWAQMNDADATLHAHPKGVASVRFHPAGDRLISAGRDGRVIVWETRQWTRLMEIRYSDESEVNEAALSGDGSLLAVVGDDGRLAVYRVADGGTVFDEPIAAGRLFDVAWIGDTMEVATGGDGTTLWIVDVMSGRRRSTELEIAAEGRAADPSHPDEITCMVYIASSRNLLAVSLTPATVRYVDPVTLTTQPEALSEHPLCGSIGHMAPDYVITSHYKNLTLWHTEDGSLASTLPLERIVQCMEYSSSARGIVVGYRDGTTEILRLDDVLAGRIWSRRRYAHNDRAAAVDISPDGTWLASGGWDGDVKLYRSSSLREPVDQLMSGLPFRIQFSACGRWLAVSDVEEGRAGRVTMFDARSGKRLWTTGCLPGPGKTPDPPPFHRLPLSSFDDSGDEFLMIDVDWSIEARDARSGRINQTYSIGAESQISGIHFTPDGKRLFIRRLSSDGLVVDRSSGAVVDRAPATCLGIFRTIHGDLWLDRDRSQNLVLRDAPTGNAVLVLRGFSGQPEAAAISPDGRYLAVGAVDHLVYCWDLARGGLPRKYVGHENEVVDVQFSADGRTILSRGHDEALRLWDVMTPAQLLALGQPGERVLSMGLSPKGDLLVYGVQHRVNALCGLYIHRLGPNRDSLARTLEFPPVEAP